MRFGNKKLVKTYLDSRGISDSTFKNNLPCIDWLNGFISRHSLTQRLADNVYVQKAEVSADTVNEYFDTLNDPVEGHPPVCTFVFLITLRRI